MISASAVLLAAAVAAGSAQIYRLDLLPRFRESVRVASVSSYDRTGGNDDGFSGKYSFVRREAGGLVLAELEGPGAIYRIWTPTPTGDLFEFYFDGEAQPRIRVKFRELFTGAQPPFLSPLSGFGGGGFYSYVPITYSKSCKIIAKASKIQFYQINYATYPKGSGIESYRPGADAAALLKAAELLRSAGRDISKWLVPPGGRPRTLQVRRAVAAGQSAALFDIKQPGRIVGLRLAPASAFAGKDRPALLKIYWDGDPEPAVMSPVGDFFGYAWGQPAARSLLVGTEGGENYAYLPMPFDKSARVELVSDRALDVRAELVFAPAPRAADEGKFYALWRRENPTTAGMPFTFIDTRGRGHLVGVALQTQGEEPGNTYFFEGDDQATIDGELTIHGTGSEDFFNGGWYDVPGRWDRRLSLPLSGCLGYEKPLGRTGGYRFFLGDAYSFRQSLKLAIEHGPTGNQLRTDYAAVTYLYSEKRPTADFAPPTPAARRVVDPKRVIFTPGWNVPLDAFPFQNATLAKKNEKFGGESVRFLSLKTTGKDMFGAHALALGCDLPSQGAYRILIQAIHGPSAPRVQLMRDEKEMGTAADLHAVERKKGELVPLGVLEMIEGRNSVFFKLTPRQPAGEAELELVQVVFERQDP